MATKHLFIQGPKCSGKTKLAQSILDLTPSKFTTIMGVNINSIFLGKYKELPYLKKVLFDEVDSEEQILEIVRLMEMFAPDCALIFTSNVLDIDMSKDERFNVFNTF
ncbi:hypothetical protein [Aureispira sp. CCB-QB1]|uniref:hypothetical protein n=1 Tax=Aureispira sp. CCB-QB1 TaxID=1313421 RepID=UPI000696AB32|nr:hypothetical protein [Aureispira sp. CCB-QB1]